MKAKGLILTCLLVVALLSMIKAMSDKDKDGAVRIREERTGSVCHAENTPDMDRGYKIICDQG